MMNFENKTSVTFITGILLLLCFLVLCNPFAMVGPGERGIKIKLGEVEPESYGEGLHLVFPFIQKFKVMNIKTQKNTYTTSVYTKDIQQARITYVINFNVQPDKVHKLFQNVGTDYLSTIVTPVVEGTIKDIIGKWNAQDLIANREKATGDILFKLQSSLKDNYINVTDFQITDINYSEVFERAIESKVTAEQEALKAKNKTVQVEEEAKQKVIAAEAEAKSMAIRAKALSQNKSLVQYEAVQKWDGKMPQYMLGSSVPFINVTPESVKR
ncbi:MAG: prohibitin family protein [Candidatus Gastranaerophilaceae bacterium]